MEDRIQVLSALECINHLIGFEEETPCGLIRELRPDSFVKGGDYTRERLPEASLVEEQGGTVHILPLTEDRSTTRMIEQIRGAVSDSQVLASSLRSQEMAKTKPGVER